MQQAGMIAGVALVALAMGIAGGAAVAASAARRRPRTTDEASVARVEAKLEVQGAEMRRLADAAAGRELAGEQLRTGIDGARRALEELAVREQERRTVDADHREVIRRLSTVLAGGAAKGRAGENILREHLSELPPGMLVTDFRVGGKVVEFGLLLPDGRRLPIDSKWTAHAELEALEAATDQLELDVCARAVERAVAGRAREVARYLDPAITAPVAVAAVPDAAYGVLKKAHAEAYAHGVVVVPYSSALPIILFLYSLVQRFGDAADVQSSLSEVVGVLDAMEQVVENKFVRAGVMIGNGADEFRSGLGKARGSIARARRGADVKADADAQLAVDVDPLHVHDDDDAGPLSVVR
ncbi:MAG: DNA recombination protein RmuC [Actinomycetota bacterium]|nr:DNA recombination protein RmuC [Actinomycetota bacterium]